MIKMMIGRRYSSPQSSQRTPRKKFKIISAFSAVRYFFKWYRIVCYIRNRRDLFMIVETVPEIIQFVHRSTFGNSTHCGTAILVVFFDTRTVLTLASWAFAFYDTLQCLTAIIITGDRNQIVGVALVAVAMEFNLST